MSEQTPEKCLMADCAEDSAHFCVTHVLEVHCPTESQLAAAVAERDKEIARLKDEVKEARGVRCQCGAPLTPTGHQCWS